MKINLRKLLDEYKYKIKRMEKKKKNRLQFKRFLKILIRLNHLKL
jgi:hypothetical protein